MEEELSYEELHTFFHSTIKELMTSLRPVLSSSDMEAEILDTLGRLVAEWKNKENIRKSIMVLAAMFLELGMNKHKEEEAKKMVKDHIDRGMVDGGLKG